MNGSNKKGTVSACSCYGSPSLPESTLRKNYLAQTSLRFCHSVQDILRPAVVWESN